MINLDPEVIKKLARAGSPVEVLPIRPIHSAPAEDALSHDLPGEATEPAAQSCGSTDRVTTAKRTPRKTPAKVERYAPNVPAIPVGPFRSAILSPSLTRMLLQTVRPEPVPTPEIAEVELENEVEEPTLLMVENGDSATSSVIEPELTLSSPIEEPVVEEPVIKEPVIAGPVTEEPVTQQPVGEQPVSEMPVADEFVPIPTLDEAYLSELSAAIDGRGAEPPAASPEPEAPTAFELPSLETPEVETPPSDLEAPTAFEADPAEPETVADALAELLAEIEASPIQNAQVSQPEATPTEEPKMEAASEPEWSIEPEERVAPVSLADALREMGTQGSGFPDTPKVFSGGGAAAPAPTPETSTLPESVLEINAPLDAESREISLDEELEELALDEKLFPSGKRFRFLDIFKNPFKKKAA